MKKKDRILFGFFYSVIFVFLIEQKLYFYSIIICFGILTI
jgi:hypothetical protein